MHATVTTQDQDKVLSPVQDEETLVLDERGDVRPSEQVERKLVTLLNRAALPVSQLHQMHHLRRPHFGDRGTR